ncbi:unnamed protein product, partial [Brassica oleracea var. botrytis]
SSLSKLSLKENPNFCYCLGGRRLHRLWSAPALLLLLRLSTLSSFLCLLYFSLLGVG